MHISSKEVAFTGVMTAFAVLLITLGGYFESCTLFLLAAASFLTGIVFREISLKAAALFVAGTVLLGIFLTPQKLYLLTFFGFCIYILAAEFLEKTQHVIDKKADRWKIWGIKAVLYHAMLCFAVFLIQKFFGLELLFDKGVYEKLQGMNGFFIFAVIFGIAVVELVWILFDRAYFYFQDRYAGVFSRFFQE